MTDKLTLKDVDGTIPGRAALMNIDLSKMFDSNYKGPQFAGFVEGEYDCTDPIQSCWGLWESIKDDFPGHTVTVIANPRAMYLEWVTRLSQLGITGSEATPQQFLDAKA